MIDGILNLDLGLGLGIPYTQKLKSNITHIDTPETTNKNNNQIHTQLQNQNQQNTRWDMEMLALLKHNKNFEKMDDSISGLMDIMLNLIKDIRKNYNNIFTIFCINNEQNNTHDNYSHKLVQCSNTVNILFDLFFKTSDPKFKNMYNDQIHNIIITNYVIRGSIGKESDDYINLPDHEFLTLVIGNKFYILQSYYYGYTLNSINGFKELNLDQFLKLHNIVWEFHNYYNKFSVSNAPPITESEKTKLKHLKQQFEFFTGIESRLHEADVDYKETFLFERKNIIIPYKLIECYVNEVRTNICDKSKRALDKIINDAGILKINFDYTYYNAFKNIKNLNTRYIFNKYTGLNLNEDVYTLLQEKYKNDRISEYELKYNLEIDIAQNICTTIASKFDCTNLSCNTTY